MRFTGNIDAKVDEKGRVFIPASFRKVLQLSNLDSLILRKDVFQRCLVLYPEAVWNSMVDSIALRTNPFDRKGRESLRAFVAGAEKISIDGNGRILIPRRYLDSADIQNEVRFLGMDNSIEIWSRQKIDELLSNRESFAENLEQLMNTNCNES